MGGGANRNIACQVGGEGRGQAVRSCCERVVSSDPANSSSNLVSYSNLILLCLLFCNRPTFCNCTICNEVYMEEKVGGSQVYNTEAACIFIGLRQIIKLSFDISTNIQKSW